MSDTTNKPGSRTKQAWDALRMMEELGFDSPEAMQAALRESAQAAGAAIVEALVAPTTANDPITATTNDFDFTISTVTAPDATEPDETYISTVTDPLAWITAKTPHVEIVSSITVFGLHPGNVGSGLGALNLKARSSDTWASCPFDFRSEDRVAEQNKRVMHAKWWHHTFNQNLAKLVYANKVREVPAEAVIGVDDFQGWDGLSKSARGTFSPLREFVPLREEVRRLLQRHGNTFLNWSYHRDQFSPLYPNPYRNRIDDVGHTILPAVKNWTDEQRQG